MLEEKVLTIIYILHMPLKMETHISGEVLILHCTGRLVYGDETAAFRARVKHMLL